MGQSINIPRMDGHARFDTLQVALTESSSITRTVVADNNGKFYYSTGSTGGGGGGTGTVTNVSVVTANGLAGSVANPTTTPSITLSTTVTGILKGNGTAISAATPGTDYITSTAGTASWSQNSVTSSFVTASNVYGPYGSNSVISASYTATSSFATSASYAANGGVTQLLAGTNITLSPTNGLGQVTISSTGGGSGSNYNTATGSYGSFYDTTTQTATTINTPYSMSFNTTDISNGVSISGSGNTKIKFTNPGVYDLQFSAQLARAVGSGTENVLIWIRKNGSNISNSNTNVTFAGGTNVRQVAAWNWFLNVAASDYYEIMWSTTSTNIVLQSDATTTPAIPSVIATVTRIDTFLSNTGSFSGSFTGNLIGTASYANYASQSLSASYALTASYALISTSASYASNTTSASYATTASYALSATTASYATTSSNVLGGAANYIPLWNTNTTLSSSVMYQSSGNVGIGTTSPGSYKLAVAGDVQLGTNQSRPVQYDSNGGNFRITPNAGGWATGYLFNNLSGTYKGGFGAYGTSASDFYYYWIGPNFDTPTMVITSGSTALGGSVGIGTTSPSTKLHVSGGNSTLHGVIVGDDQTYGSPYKVVSFGNNADGNNRIFAATNTADGMYFAAATGRGFSFRPNGGTSDLVIINSSGNVGIGTTSPSYTLDINGTFRSKGFWTDDSAISYWGNGPITSSYGILTYNTGYAAVYATSGNNLRLGANNSISHLFISASGNVGIGTTDPTDKLYVSGSVYVKDGIIRIEKTASDTVQLGPSLYLIGGSGASYSQLQQGVGRFTIWGFNGSLWNETLTINNSTGNVGIGTTSPSTRLHTAGSTQSTAAAGVARLGFADSSSVALFSNGDVNYGTLFGTLSSGKGWIQQQRVDGTATAYDLILQPNGGNVGIGTTSPSSLLTVAGNISSSAAVYFKGITSATQTNIVGIDTTTGQLYYQTTSSLNVSSASYAATASNVLGGTTNYLARWTSATTLGIGVAYDNGTNVGIGTTSPEALLHINKSTAAGEGGYLYLDNPATSTLGNKSGIKFGTSNGASFASVPTGEITNIVTSAGSGASALTFGTFDGSSSGERLRITSGGQLLVGSTSSIFSATGRGVVEINGVSTSILALTVNGASAGYFYHGGTDLSVWNVISGNIQFGTNNIERMRITSGGDVGIGTTSPAYKLDVNGTLGVTGQATFSSTVVLSSASTLLSNAIAAIQFRNAGSLRWELDREVTETGSNVGSNLTLYRYDDSGNFLGTSFTLSRATGAATFSSTVTASSFIKSGGTSAQYLMADGSTSTLTNPVTGTGTTNYLPKWTSGTAIGDSLVYDNGTNVGIGTTSPSGKLQIANSPADSLVFDADSSAFGGRYALLPGIFSIGTLGNGYPEAGYNFATSGSVYTKIGNDTAWGISYGNSSVMSFKYAAAGTGTFSWNTAMVINLSGNVGIGTTSPLTRLDLRASTNSSITSLAIVPDTTTTLLIGNIGTNGVLALGHDNAGHPWLQGRSALANQPAEDILINPLGGNVGIGTTSPQSQLHIYNNSAGVTFRLQGTRTADGEVGVINFSNITDIAGGYIIGSIAVNRSGYDNGGAMIFSTATAASTPTERMRITSAGTVGIGTTSPQNKLHVDGSNEFIRISNSSTGDGGIKISYQNSDTHGLHLIYNPSTAVSYIDNTYPTASGQVYGDIYFRQNVGSTMTSRMMIQARSGNVGIGTTSPATKLQVNGTFASNALWTDAASIGYWGNYSTAYGGLTWDSGYALVFAAGGNALRLGANGTNTYMTINTSGNVGIGTTSPSYLLDVNRSSLGAIAQFIANDGTYNPRLLISGTAEGVQLFATYSTVADALMFGTGNTEKMRITSGGNVGINCTATNAKLEVVSTTGEVFRADAASGAYRIVATQTGVNMNGNVGIGTTSPVRKLEVYTTTEDLHIAAVGSAPSLNLLDASSGATIAGTIGLATGTNNFIQNSVPGDLCISTRGSTNASAYIMFGSGSTMTAYISGSGDMYIAGTLTQGSTRNIKENIVPISNALSIVTQIQGVTYNKKDGSATNEPGFIAEDMYSILPSLVSLDRAGDPQGIKYTNLTAYLLEAIKELKAEIDILKNKT